MVLPIFAAFLSGNWKSSDFIFIPYIFKPGIVLCVCFDKCIFMKKSVLYIFLAVLFVSCKKNSPKENVQPANYYYPPLTSEIWESKTASSIGWDEGKLNAAFEFAGSKNTFGLIVLHQGKIVKEQYWNNWTKDTRYYLASAGKSVLAVVVGLAQQEGIIKLGDRTSKYLGTGWTSLSIEKENLITIKNQLSMTTGLDEKVADPDCQQPGCLVYKADAGTRWAYHNAPYRLMQKVLSEASGMTWNAYSKKTLFDKIGMKGIWFENILYCTTRDAARFGSMVLRKGEWDGQKILSDQKYFEDMINSSQDLNLSYGYLWWLNGKNTVMLPGFQAQFPGPLVLEAPADMIMALGKDDKKIYVVPSLDVVVVRLGDSAGASAAGPGSFDHEIWAKLKLAMKY